MAQENKTLSLRFAALAMCGALFVSACSNDNSDNDAAQNEAPAEITVADSSGEKAAVKATPAKPAANLGALETPNPMGEIVLGQADAPITIVEYSSLTCPHCGAFHRDTLPKLKKQYIDEGLVKIYFRPFPFDPYATAGAMLAQCVAPKAQVNFLDILFKRQQQWIQSEQPMDALLAFARQAGLSEADFVVCLKDESKLESIRQMQAAAADELGVRSTPTFFVNGEKIEGNRGLDAFDKVIKPLLP